MNDLALELSFGIISDLLCEVKYTRDKNVLN